MDRKTENQLRQEIAEVWALLDAERTGRAALIRRIEQEEQAKTIDRNCIITKNDNDKILVALDRAILDQAIQIAEKESKDDAR